MDIKELENKTLADILNSDVKFLDKEKDWSPEDEGEWLEDLKKQKINIGKKLTVGDKTFLFCNCDWVLVCKDEKVIEIFNVYDLESRNYDKDIDSLIVTGHETLHRYVVSSGKYKVTYTR